MSENQVSIPVLFKRTLENFGREEKSRRTLSDSREPELSAASASSSSTDFVLSPRTRNRETSRIMKLKKKEKKEAAEAQKIVSKQRHTQQALEKRLRKAPSVEHPDILPSVAPVAGNPDPVSIKFSNGFIEKHVEGGLGSAMGKTKTIIGSHVLEFEPGMVVPNPKGSGARITLTSKNNVDLQIHKMDSTGIFNIQRLGEAGLKSKEQSMVVLQ